jgi:hypothetical protein
MIYNGELHRKALDIINAIQEINFEFGGKIPQKDIDKMSANLITNFVLDICEKQKGQKDNIFNTDLLG